MTTHTDRMTVEVFSDYVCPFCYMAKASLDQVQERVPLEVTWRAFELRPGGAMPEPAYAEMIRSRFPQTQAMAREFGVEMKTLRLGTDTRAAHRAYKIVQEMEPERAEPLNRALYRAYFEEGSNLGDLDVLAGVAERVGVDGAALRARLEAGEALDEVIAEEQEAQANGITGVPAFIFMGKYLLSGVRRPEEIERAIQQIREQEGLAAA